MADGVLSADRVAVFEEAERRGLLSPEQGAALNVARERGWIPTEETNFFDSNVHRYTMSLDPDALDDDYAAAVNSYWMRKFNSSPNIPNGFADDTGASIFPYAEPNPKQNLKRIQAVFNRDRYKGILKDDLDRFNEQDPEAQLKEAWREIGILGRSDIEAAELSPEETMAQQAKQQISDKEFAETFDDDTVARRKLVQSLGSLIPEGRDLDSLTPTQKDAVVKAYKKTLFRKSQLKYRLFLESQLSQASIDIGREMAFRKIKDVEFFSIVPNDQKPTLAAYIKHLRKTDHAPGVVGSFTEAGHSLYSGLENLVGGGLMGAAEFGLAVVTLPNKEVGSEESSQWYQDLQELQKDKRLVAEAFGAKGPEDASFIRRGFVGVAGSLPYMVAVATPGLNKVGIPLAVSAMSREFRGDMIDDGADPDEAWAYAIPAAILNVVIERALGVGGKGVPGMASVTKREAAAIASKSLARKLGSISVEFGKDYAKTVLEESLEEVLQDTTKELAKQFALSKTDARALAETAINTAQESLPAVMFMAFGGGVFNTYKKTASTMLENNQKLAQAEEDAVTKATKDTNQMQAAMGSNFSAVAQEWNPNDSQSKKVEKLRELGVTNIDAAIEEMDTVSSMFSNDTAGQNITSANDLKRANDILSSFGLNARIVESLVDDNGVAANALYKDGEVLIDATLDIDPTSADFDKMVYEEAIHGVRIQQGVTVDDVTLIQKILPQLREQLGKEYNTLMRSFRIVKQLTKHWLVS